MVFFLRGKGERPSSRTGSGPAQPMNYATIKRYDVANGPGVRVSLFVSGCTHACPGCFNPEAWDFHYGEPFTAETEESILSSLAPEYIKGLSLLGGEPFDPRNQPALAPFVRRVRDAYPDKSIWCYTGYVLDPDLRPGGIAWTEYTEDLLGCIDILVDGPFIEAQKDLNLRFRGSANQRILRLADTLRTGQPVWWESDQ